MAVLDVLKVFRRGAGEGTQYGSPFGAALVTPEIDQMIAQGFGHAVTVGALSTGIVGGGDGTVLDLDQPELAIAVPAGYCIRPFEVKVQVQTGLVAADNNENEILVAVDVYGLWTGDGTSTPETPQNLRTDLKGGSACRVGSAFTGNMTTTRIDTTAAAPVLDSELDRTVETAEIVLATGGEITLMKQLTLRYAPKTPRYIVGPATVLVYFGGTVATLGGYIQAAWVEGRTSEFFVTT